MTSDVDTATPTSDVDLYSDEVLLNPYETYRALRDAGPAVWMSQHSVFALPRYAEVKAALHDWELYSSAQGVALNATMNSHVGGLVAIDPPEHTQARAIAMRPLAASRLRAISDRIDEAADGMVRDVVQRSTIDGVVDFAQRIPLLIVADLVGLPKEGTDRMLEWGSNVGFNTMGPENARTAGGLAAIPPLLEYLQREVRPDTVKPDSWAADLFQQAQEEGLPLEWAQHMMVNYIVPSMDTTIQAMASALWLFANHPEQYQLLRSDPALATRAVNEVLRLESPVQGFSRVLTRDHEIGGVRLPEGSRAIVMFGSANRDERYWDDPERFDVQRADVGGHLAFGFGQHVCMGQGLARLELKAQFTALARHVEHIELIDAEPMINNTLRGFKRLAMRLS